MEEVQEKTCTTCKYYVEHYIKKDTCFHPIGGHCVNDELNAIHKRNKFRLYENCGFWENGESLKTDRKQSIKETLEKMQKSIEQIALVLEDDK